MEFVVGRGCWENRVDCANEARDCFARSAECVDAISYEQKSQSHVDHLVIAIVHFRFKFFAQDSHHPETLDIATTRHNHAKG